MNSTGTWTGSWVARNLGVRLRGADDGIGPRISTRILPLASSGAASSSAAPSIPYAVPGDDAATLRDLVGLALRRNPRRAHLLVSTVLGKHVPQLPHVVHDAGLELGARVRAVLDGDGAAPVVLGYAETATGLGHCVAEALPGATYLHSTRRPVPGVTPLGGFEEEHSHATSHLLLPEDPELLSGGGPLVLVDDELSTGRTVLNTIETVHGVAPRDRYVIAALIDVRTAADRLALDAFAARLGARVDVVALGGGVVELPGDALTRGAALVAAEEARAAASATVGPAAEVPAAPVALRLDADWPRGLPDGGRHGFTPAHHALLDSALPRLGAALAERVAGARRVLVLGSEELMYVPLRMARALADAAPDSEIRYSTTTRSPVLAVDDPGYAIRTRLTFPAHDDPADGPGDRFTYNVAPGADPARRFDTIVLVVDSVGDTPALHAPGGLLDALARVTDRVVLAVVPSYVPATPAPVPSDPEAAPVTDLRDTGKLPEPLLGPGFSSYAADEVAWLLKDLSDVELEAPLEEREEAIQHGGAHYAESLPIEYQPSPEYQALFHTALEESADRIAHAVGVVTEIVLAERGHDAVLVSLARAGTPVGVLMRRWAQFAYGIDVPHYSVSIVRARGIDAVALRWLARSHDPARVMFVDGWTGKGAITRELTAALDELHATTGLRFSDEMAVLADPGSCVRTYGTRDDFLIPSACLNSTVSGLVSRTVLRDGLIGPDDFHGAKFYRELAGADMSNLFLDTVAARFPAVADDVARDWPALAASDRTPSWDGWRAVERIGAEYGIDNVNLIKPGVGETTRVLLRRVPWMILARRGVGTELDHVRMLADQRGVPVVEVDDLPYSCVGLVKPGFRRDIGVT